MKRGQFVSRKSYQEDIVFRIEKINSFQAYLRGADYRLVADAPLSDLVLSMNSSFSERNLQPVQSRMQPIRLIEQIRAERMKRYIWHRKHCVSNFFEAPGKVLHLDGDCYYLQKCMQIYRQLEVPVRCFHIPEPHMADAIRPLLIQLKPQIVVLTGHDGLLKNTSIRQLCHLASYKNSLHFVRAVQVARQFERNLDLLTIIAGACQSHFEALLEAGANFASSPARAFIHAVDPVCIASKVAYTSVHDIVSMLDIVDLTMTGVQGIGGLETRGCYRSGIPRLRCAQKLYMSAYP